MTASPVKARLKRFFWPALALAAGLGVLAAVMQLRPSVTVPVTVVPPPPPAAPSPPPAPPAVPAQPAAPAPVSPPAPPPPVPDPGAKGLLAAAAGGLGADLWHQTPTTRVQELLGRLPLSMASKAGRQLMGRLLISDAEGPLGPPGGPAGARALGALRVEALARLGRADEALALLAVVGQNHADEAAVRAVAEAALAAGVPACGPAAGTPQGMADPFRAKLAVWCAVDAGDPAGARRALEQPAAAEPLFQALGRALVDGPPADLFRRIEGLGRPGLLELAMMRRIPVAVPAAVAGETEDPVALALIARNPASAPEIRLVAGERAASAFFLEPQALAEIYRLAPGPADGERGPRTRAAVFRAFHAAAAGRRRVALAHQALDLLEPEMWGGPVGTLVAGMIDTLSPTPDVAALAPAAARLYDAQGQIQPMRRWRDLAAATGQGGSLWALLTVSGTAAPVPRPNLLTGGVSWGEPGGGGRRPQDDGASRLAAYLAWQAAPPPDGAATLDLLKTLGIEPPPAIRAEGPAEGAGGEGGASGETAAAAPAASTPPPVPSSDPLDAELDRAAAAGRRGEAVLLAMIRIGPGGPASRPAGELAAAVRALVAVGLEAEARALVREAVAGRAL